MQIAQKMAGYSLGGADLLRRAMGKKIAAEMEAQREIFTKGAIEPVGGGTEEIGKLSQADSDKYARLVKELHIKTN